MGKTWTRCDTATFRNRPLGSLMAGILPVFRHVTRWLESRQKYIQDIDFEHRAIVVRSGRGRKDRVVTLPDELIVSLKRAVAMPC